MANQSEENKMQIYVKTLKGTSQAFGISNDETVDTLMNKVEEQLGIKKKEQRLIFGGKNLISGKKMTDYRIKHGSTIHLVFRNIGGMSQIFVKTLQGKSKAFDITNDETVDTFMNKVEQEFGIQKDQQRLLFGGKNLISGKKLTDYRIKHGSTIHLVFRQLGGN
ncbi:hypothetical protein M0811_05330 [Anaeramoeba ignava]|uniref:Ubiquitin-like domain-containing protein n=1 Tax=Anaeramoeba ignava TaxID=1746090 RepID=A0A9Q0RFC4_ANAIG|nr:hypothetical protein M0811_05330 [Anaeramoeba ignava]